MTDDAPIDFDLTSARRSPGTVRTSEDTNEFEITSPMFPLEALESLSIYHALSRDRLSVLISEFLLATKHTPSMRRALESLDPKELVSRAESLWREQERAIVHGDWSACLRTLHEYGVASAERGVPFADWCHLANVLRGKLARIAAEKGSELFKALDGVDHFLAIAIATIGEAYVATTEARVRAERRRHELIVEGAIDGILSFDSQFRIVAFNSMATQIFGWSIQSVRGSHWLETLLTPESAASVLIALENDRDHGTNLFFGKRVPVVGKRRSGDPFPLEIAVVRLGTSNEAAFAAFARDMTRERELERATHFLAAIVQSSTDAIVSIDSSGRVMSWNPGAASMYGFTELEARGRVFDELVGSTAFSVLRTKESSSVGAMIVEGTHRTRNGDRIDVAMGLSPLYSTDGSVLALAVIVRDVTAQKRAEAELAHKAKELARSNEELSHFASVASHDLRAPLRAVEGLSRALETDLGKEIDPNCAEHLRLLRSRVRRMDRMIEDLLAFARAGQPLPRTESVDLAALFVDVIATIARDPRFCMRIEGHPPVVETHRIALERVLTNLLTNAVKHHDRIDGTVTISATLEVSHRLPSDRELDEWVRRTSGEYEAPSSTNLVVMVADDGPGIPADQRQSVFAMFYAGGKEPTGSGMGLAIVKKIVERRGGFITLLDGAPRGLKVRVVWPLDGGTVE